ncbi:MAG: DUF3127 domain-containing protein [Bacteroidales bacterium]|nr:DUF3127 domain-containing protein [Candidatus Sodaliphilus fimicaballi]
MEIKGKIIYKLPLQSGVSKAGNNWSKQEYVLETMENFPKKVHFDFFGDRINQYPLEVGQVVNLSFDIESREYNGRWFTSIRGWKAEQVDENAVAAAAAPAPYAAAPMAPAQEPMAPAAPYSAAPATDFGNTAPEDDLPF